MRRIAKSAAKNGLADSAMIDARMVKTSKNVEAFDHAERMIQMEARLGKPAMRELRALMRDEVLGGAALIDKLSDLEKAAIETEVYKILDSVVSRASAKDPDLLANIHKGQIAAKGYKINVAGIIREVFGRDMPEIGLAARRLRIEAAALRMKRPTAGIEVIDSHVLGVVELPTQLDGKRSIRLGTNSLMGLGVIEPGIIEDVTDAGVKVKIEYVGVMKVRLGVEVKGRTTAGDGLKQAIRLEQHGTRGYALIGGRVWLVEYVAKDVQHFVVAPAGDAVVRAASDVKQLRTLGFDAVTVKIPTKMDEQFNAAAENMVRAVLTGLGLAK